MALLNKARGNRYPPMMLALKHWLLALVGLAFIMAGTGTHIRLCFDGQEPPTSVHWVDAERGNLHSGQVQVQDHDDVDLAGVAQALLKTLHVDLSPVLPSWGWAIQASPSIVHLRPVAHQVLVAISRSRFLLPPLRGPPR